MPIGDSLVFVTVNGLAVNGSWFTKHFQELLRHAPGSRVTMERYAHVTLLQQREAADILERAVAGGQSVTQSLTETLHGVGGSRPESPVEGDPRGKVGSGGRTRTYDQAVNSRPLYH